MVEVPKCNAKELMWVELLLPCIDIYGVKTNKDSITRK